MRKIVCVLGPTAVGKTALSVQIAEKYNGVMLSVDSIQVYNKLDIISGKDLDSLGNIPLKLVDLVSPLTPYNVSDYVSDFKKELDSDLQKLPILVGGTGFYISALLNPIETKDIKPNIVLRRELNPLTTSELQGMLKVLNAEKFLSMNNSDKNNPRRLIRAIEIEKSEYPKEINESPLRNFEILIIGLRADKKTLDARINKRVDERVKHGALKEAESLFHDYDNLVPQVKQASGYKQLFEYFQGKINLEEAIEKWKTAEHQNAKKQLTWFKKKKNIEWFDIESGNFEAQVLQKVEVFLRN
ncbi:MAG: tRNA (adenosine(37)-N6)-dimethylallyltransferase MiaA [Candidatus Levybacteria bacterium]|nr:tRNA (adenosine(37)-N6)-dimethylallyltransferase MiaA [Candidatus Levybacteria bacterium]